MKIVVGNKSKTISSTEFNTILGKYDYVVLDIGTGDGRFVYENALKNLNKLYIGIDPVESQLRIYSKKAVRKKLSNTLFIVGSIEEFPSEINNIADEITVFLPWGSLLKSIINVDKHLLNIKSALKLNGQLEILLGYNLEAEPSETQRLKLPILDETAIMKLIGDYKKIGLTLKNWELLDRNILNKSNTSWSKKLSFGKKRPIYRLIFYLTEK